MTPARIREIFKTRGYDAAAQAAHLTQETALINMVEDMEERAHRFPFMAATPAMCEALSCRHGSRINEDSGQRLAGLPMMRVPLRCAA